MNIWKIQDQVDILLLKDCCQAAADCCKAMNERWIKYRNFSKMLVEGSIPVILRHTKREGEITLWVYFYKNFSLIKYYFSSTVELCPPTWDGWHCWRNSGKPGKLNVIFIISPLWSLRKLTMDCELILYSRCLNLWEGCKVVTKIQTLVGFYKNGSSWEKLNSGGK